MDLPAADCLNPGARLRFDIVVECAIEVGGRKLQHPLQHIGSPGVLFVERKHFQNRVEAELLIHELANLRRLKVSDRNSIGSFRPNERGVEIVDLDEAAIAYRLQVLERPVVAPASPRATLFVYRQTFREPARNSMIGHLERDHMSKLVPQRTPPVELTRRSRRGAVHRDHLTEADSERAKTGNPKRADLKIAVVCKDLD